MQKYLFGLVLLVLVSSSASAASFTPLGDLPGGGVFSQANGVSADGSVVVGLGSSASGTEAFRWTGGVMTGLGDLPLGGFDSRANGVSADGSVVVGLGTIDLDNDEAFRWTGGVMTGLGDLRGGLRSSGATGVSPDGSVVVGWGTSNSGTEAFRWTGGVMTGLGDLPGGAFLFKSRAYGVSADGSVVVGLGSSASGNEAFRWTGGVMTGLGDLPGGFFGSVAYGVSADGSVVVGRGNSASGYEAFRWTGGVMTGLGDLAGGDFDSTANAVSADGSVVVGSSISASGTEAILWTSGGGMERLLDVLLANGATGLTGWTLESVLGISSDGQWVVGVGVNPLGEVEAFLASITPIDLTTGTTGSVLVNQSFNGETRSADVTLLGANNQQVTSMRVAAVDIRDTSALVGARIYTSSGLLIAAADLNVPVGDDQTITVPIAATLTPGNSYRLAFFVPSSASGNTGDLFDPAPAGVGGFGYVESQGLFQVNGGFQGLGDVFPTNVSLLAIPRIGVSAATPPDADGDTIPDASDNCPVTANTNQADADADLRGDACDNCRLLANNTGPAAQCDSDGDGYGNHCDADLNNNGSTNAQDTTLYRQQLGQPSVGPTYNEADLNCNGAVNAQDTTLFRQLLGKPPGPSGLVP